MRRPLLPDGAVPAGRWPRTNWRAHTKYLRYLVNSSCLRATNSRTLGQLLSTDYPGAGPATVLVPQTALLSPHAPRPTPHAPRSLGVRRRCRVPSWVQHPPPGRGQHATTCYVFRFRQKFGEPGFRRKLILNHEFTSISPLTLVERNCRLNCMLIQELRRYDPRGRLRKKPPFRPLFGAFYPHPAHKSALRAEWATHFSGTRETWLAPNVPLATVLRPRPTPHAPRRRDQRGQVVRRPSPAGYCLTPTGRVAGRYCYLPAP